MPSLNSIQTPIKHNRPSAPKSQEEVGSNGQTRATAPGKIILVGEHAVVYGRPAIAAPVWGVKAIATISNASADSGCTILAPDIDLQFRLTEAADDQPLAFVLQMVLRQLGTVQEPDWTVELRSELPIAGGLGSGAALSTALVRAIYAHVGQTVSPDLVSEIVFESERFYHGTPSGIDNTVIAHGKPIWFVKGTPVVIFQPKQTLHLLIADSGIRSPTRETVGDVRQGWLADRDRFEKWFDAIAEGVLNARLAIEQGMHRDLGLLLDQNHAILQQMGVSSPLLDQLVDIARNQGALGAKLSGGGRGGNIIALVEDQHRERIAQALLRGGAKRVIESTVQPEIA